MLLTGSKDGHVRAWDLATQHCFQMLAGAYGEVPRAHLCIQAHAQQPVVLAAGCEATLLATVSAVELPIAC